MKGKAECCLRERVVHKWPPQTNVTRNQPRSRALNELQKTHSWRAQLSAASARLGLERPEESPGSNQFTLGDSPPDQAAEADVGNCARHERSGTLRL